jgi:hypothetical protein
MEALQILKFSIRKERPLKFTEGMSWSEELREFELLARTAPLGDAEAYGRSLEENDDDSDNLSDDLDESVVNLEVLGEQFTTELESTEDGEEDEDEDEDDIYL